MSWLGFRAVELVGGGLVGLVVAMVTRAEVPRTASPASPSAASSASPPSSSSSSPSSSSSSITPLPEAESAIAIDGELEEPAWQSGVARTGPLRAPTGGAARPYSDARFTWRGDTLYVTLYAADETIHDHGPTRDLFRVALNGHAFTAAADGALDGAPPGTRAAVDRDGVPDDDRDDDEEWAVELAVPLPSIGVRGARGEVVAASVERCDTPRDGVRRCGAWSGRLGLEQGGAR